ncbi:MAG TPA: hypothetical protein VFA45_15080 [Actinomycetes bacterium]|nr:hypothetical protein [Actinomycetes bacterium]
MMLMRSRTAALRRTGAGAGLASPQAMAQPSDAGAGGRDIVIRGYVVLTRATAVIGSLAGQHLIRHPHIITRQQPQACARIRSNSTRAMARRAIVESIAWYNGTL